MNSLKRQRASPSLNLWISLPICQLFGTIRGSICPPEKGTHQSHTSHCSSLKKSQNLLDNKSKKLQTLDTFLRRDNQQQATHQSHTSLFHWFCSTFLRNFLSLGKLVGNPSNHRTHCRLVKIHQVTRTLESPE